MNSRSPFLQQSFEFLERTRSRATAALYVEWFRRYILFHHFQSAEAMQQDAQRLTREFLVSLACEQQVTSATQNQALAALLVLYRDILDIEMDSARMWAKKPRRLPEILSRHEVDVLLSYMSDGAKLMAELLYGSGLKVGECCRLRIADVDCAAKTLAVRGRRTVLAACTLPALQRRMALVAACYQARGLHDKSRWHVFPAQNLFDPDVDVCEYTHISVSSIQKAVAQAARKAHRDGILTKTVTCQSLRDSFAVALLCNGSDIRTIQELLGIRHITTMTKYMAFVPLWREGKYQSPQDVI